MHPVSRRQLIDSLNRLLHACAAKVARFKEWIDGKAKKYNIENNKKRFILHKIESTGTRKQKVKPKNERT